MSDIDATINTLRDQVEALQYDLEQATEANKEWHEVMNDHDISEVNDLLTFAQDYDVDQITNFMQNHDIDEIVSALRYEDISELVKAFNKIDEYGDPEDMAEKVERLEEEVADLSNNASDDSVDRTVYIQVLNERDEVAQRMRESDVYIVELKTKVARIENEYNALDQMYTTVTDALSLQQADYKQLSEYHERVCRECDALRAAEPGVYTQAKEDLLNKLLDLQARHIALQALYFGAVSGFDDVPSSKPLD